MIAMADKPPRAIKTRKQIDDWLKSQHQTDRARSEQIERRQKLWTALADFIRESGAWLVSPPGAKYLRIECLPGSILPAKLTEFGYSVQHCGTTTRCGIETVIAHSRTGKQIVQSRDGIIGVDILEISLPGK